MKFIMPSNIISAASIVSHCYLSFIFESYYHFKFSFLWRERRKINVSTGGKFVGIIQSGEPEVCMVKSHQIQK